MVQYFKSEFGFYERSVREYIHRFNYKLRFKQFTILFLSLGNTLKVWLMILQFI